MAVKSLNWLGIGFDSWLANGIVYAADNGALVVAAAGNESISAPLCPAVYAKALGVAALSTCSARTPRSNWAWSNFYLSAPDEDILPT